MNYTAKLLFIQCLSLKVRSYCLKPTFDLEYGPVFLVIPGPSNFLAIFGIIFCIPVFSILIKTMYEINFLLVPINVFLGNKALSVAFKMECLPTGCYNLYCEILQETPFLGNS